MAVVVRMRALDVRTFGLKLCEDATRVPHLGVHVYPELDRLSPAPDLVVRLLGASDETYDPKVRVRAPASDRIQLPIPDLFAPAPCLLYTSDAADE